MEYTNNSNRALPQFEWRVVQYTVQSLVDGSSRTINYDFIEDEPDVEQAITNQVLIESDIIVPIDDKHATQDFKVGDEFIRIKLESTKYVG